MRWIIAEITFRVLKSDLLIVFGSMALRMLRSPLLCLSFVSALGILGTELTPALAAPASLRPLTNEFCQPRFYRIKTGNGSPLQGRTGALPTDAVRTVANGTLVLDVDPYLRTRILVLPNGAGEVHVPSQTFQRSAVPLPVSPKFNGKMRVQTLDEGGYVNVRQGIPQRGEPQSPIVGRLRTGTEVTAKGWTGGDGIFGTFIYVAAPDGTEGYVASAYLVCSGR